jgi:hypothetical protein
MKIWPWANYNRPKSFGKALGILLASDKFTLTERTLAIAAGVSRYDIVALIEGNRLPIQSEVRDIAGAFVLNLFSRVFFEERRKLIDEFNLILQSDARNF